MNGETQYSYPVAAPQQQPKPQSHDASYLDEIKGQLMGINSRLRILEERFSNTQKREQVTEQNVLAHNRKMGADLKTTASDIRELKNRLEETREALQRIVNEINTMAKKEEVDVLKKYLNLWEPVKFVTTNQVERIVKEMIEEKKGQEHQESENKK